MQDNDNEKKKVIKNWEKKNLSQPRLTQLTHHMRHEIRIKKIELQNKGLTKKGTGQIKKHYEQKYKLTRVSLTNSLSK